MKKIFTILSMLLVAATTMAQVPSYVPTNGLVGYWPFNGNANDESGNGNNGTVNGATLTTDRFGNANAAYDFDGNSDFIEVNYAQAPNFSNGITMQTWVRIDGTNTNYPCATQNGDFCFQFFLSSENSFSDGHYRLSLNQSTMNLVSRVVNNGGVGVGTSSSDEVVISSPEWIHFVATYDNAIMRLYVNGSQQNQTSGSVQFAQSLATVMFGKSMNPIQYPYFTNGKLDDIGIWNRALSACEIEQLYISQVIPQPSASVNTSGSTTFCQGGSVTLSVPQADDYLWSNGATSQSITVNSTGTYSVTVTNGNSCSETSQNISVTVNSLPNVSLSSFSSICDNAPSVSLAGGSPSGGSYLVNGVQSTELNPSVTGSGMQTVAYEYTDNNGCSNTANQTVMVNQSPSVSVSGLNTTYSPTDPAVQLNGTPSGGVYSGTGVTNDGVFDPAVAGIGTHNVQYVYVDGNGCIGVDGLCTSVDMSMNIGGSNIGTDDGIIDVYPNPSNGNVTVSVTDIEGIINLSVFDVRGREVFSTAMVGNGQKTIQNIDLSNYANGVYTLSIRTAKGTTSQKLIKE